MRDAPLTGHGGTFMSESIWTRFRRTQLSGDHARNLQVLLLASVLNLSFAAEKVLLGFGIDLGNWAWAAIYGGLALVTTVMATHDYIWDVVENRNTDVERVL
jgi:hypothetical protein